MWTQIAKQQFIYEANPGGDDGKACLAVQRAFPIQEKTKAKDIYEAMKLLLGHILMVICKLDETKISSDDSNRGWVSRARASRLILELLEIIYGTSLLCFWGQLQNTEMKMIQEWRQQSTW